MTDSVPEPGFVAYARALLSLLGKEYATLESVGFCVLCIFMSCVLFTSSDSSNLLLSGRLLFSHCS